MIRILGIDPGLNLGFGVRERGRDGAPPSGSFRIGPNAKHLGERLHTYAHRVRELIVEHKPTHVIVAEPFISRVATPSALLPLFSFMGMTEYVVYLATQGAFPDLVIRGVSEQKARGYFIPPPAPKGTDAIKRAAVQACRDRGWDVCDNHAADALIVADYALARLDPEHAHESHPLFIASPKCGAKSELPSSNAAGKRVRRKRKSAVE